MITAKEARAMMPISREEIVNVFLKTIEQNIICAAKQGRNGIYIIEGINSEDDEYHEVSSQRIRIGNQIYEIAPYLTDISKSLKEHGYKLTIDNPFEIPYIAW